VTITPKIGVFFSLNVKHFCNSSLIYSFSVLSKLTPVPTQILGFQTKENGVIIIGLEPISSNQDH
jgi:hypothetical protein